MSAGCSIWWPTPARPERYFSHRELQESARRHRPLRRVALAGLVAKIGLLFSAAIVAGRLAETAPDGTGSLVAPVLVGAGLTALALRVPAVVVDWWFEYRFHHGVDDHRPVPIRWFLGTTSALTVGFFVLLTGLGWLGYRVAVGGVRWVAVLALAIPVVVVAAALGERRFRRLVPGGERALDPESPAADRLAELASEFSLVGLPFGIVRRTPDRSGPGTDPGPIADRWPDEQAPNASAVGLWRNRRVVLTDSLLAEEPAVRDFVVAHELSHLAGRHVALQAWLGLVATLAGVWLVVAAAELERLWSLFGLDPIDPRGLPIVALIVLAVGGLVGPPVAWMARALERSADAGAIDVVGPPPVDLMASLHLATATDLDPPWWVRLYAHHPTPAERLEFLARRGR